MQSQAKHSCHADQMHRAHRFRLDERVLDKVLRVNPSLAGAGQSLAEVKDKLLQPAETRVAATLGDADHTTLALFLRGAHEAWSNQSKELQDRKVALQADEARAKEDLRNSIECFLRVVPRTERDHAKSLVERHADLLSAVGLSTGDALNRLNK